MDKAARSVHRCDAAETDAAGSGGLKQTTAEAVVEVIEF
jgi:hypothetical protein